MALSSESQVTMTSVYLFQCAHRRKECKGQWRCLSFRFEGPSKYIMGKGRLQMSKSPARSVMSSNSNPLKWSNPSCVLVSLLDLSKALQGSGRDLLKGLCKVAGVYVHEVCLESECVAFMRSLDCETTSDRLRACLRIKV